MSTSFLLAVGLGLLLLGCTSQNCCLEPVGEDLQSISRHTRDDVQRTRDNFSNLGSFLAADTATSPARMHSFFANVVFPETKRQWLTTPENAKSIARYAAASSTRFPGKVRTIAAAVGAEVRQQASDTKENIAIIAPELIRADHVTEFVEYFLFPELVNQWYTTRYYLRMLPPALREHFATATQDTRETLAIFAAIIVEQAHLTPANFVAVSQYLVYFPPIDIDFLTTEFSRQLVATPENIAFLSHFLPAETRRQTHELRDTLFILYEGVNFEQSAIGLGETFSVIMQQMREGHRELPGELRRVGDLLLCPGRE